MQFTCYFKSIVCCMVSVPHELTWILSNDDGPMRLLISKFYVWQCVYETNRLTFARIWVCRTPLLDPQTTEFLICTNIYIYAVM